MTRFLSFRVLVVLPVLIFNFNLAQQPNRQMRRPLPQSLGVKNNKGPPVICTHDALLIYQDCRICVCTNPNRLAKCYKKSCDLRTKDSGQCPASILRIYDGHGCPVSQVPGCKIDAHCPGDQLCCFDFCGSSRCTNPMPLDATTGTPVHNGRGYH